MKSKIFLLSVLFFISANNTFAQHDFSVKVYGVYGFVNPKQINNYFEDLNSANKKYYNAYNQKSNKLLEDIIGYGISVSCDFTEHIGLRFSWNDFTSKHQDFNDYYFSDGGFFPDYLGRYDYKIFYDFSSYSLKPMYLNEIYENLRFSIAIGPTLNYGKFNEEFSGVYSIYSSKWYTDDKYFIKAESKYFGYSFDIGVEYNFYSTLFFELNFQYENVLHEFDGDFSMGKDKTSKVTPTGERIMKKVLNFDVSGYYLLVGLKIGII